MKQLLKKSGQFIQRLWPSGDLWRYTTLLIAISVAFFCGGYALNLLFFIKPLFSAMVLLVSGGLIIWRVINNYQEVLWLLKSNNEGGDTLEHITYILLVVMASFITLGIAIAHFWIPQTVAGISAGISLTAIIIFTPSLIKRHLEIGQTQLA